jgi:hypothetical protein
MADKFSFELRRIKKNTFFFVVMRDVNNWSYCPISTNRSRLVMRDAHSSLGQMFRIHCDA